MKFGALAALLVGLLTLLAGCPKSNDMLDHSKKPGVIPEVGSAPPGEQTIGSGPTGDAPAAPAAPPAGDTGGGDTGGGDTGGGDTGGDDGDDGDG